MCCNKCCSTTANTDLSRPRRGPRGTADASKRPTTFAPPVGRPGVTHGPLPEGVRRHIYIGDRWRCDMHGGMEPSSRSASPGDIAEGLEQAAILVVRHMSDRTALNLTASMVLDTLNREGPLRVTTLAAAAGIGQPSMTELVQRLERQRLVTRVDDPEDGRAALVTITDAGRAPLDDQRRGRRDQLAELLTALPAE